MPVSPTKSSILIGQVEEAQTVAPHWPMARRGFGDHHHRDHDCRHRHHWIETSAPTPTVEPRELSIIAVQIAAMLHIGMPQAGSFSWMGSEMTPSPANCTLALSSSKAVELQRLNILTAAGQEGRQPSIHQGKRGSSSKFESSTFEERMKNETDPSKSYPAERLGLFFSPDQPKTPFFRLQETSDFRVPCSGQKHQAAAQAQHTRHQCHTTGARTDTA